MQGSFSAFNRTKNLKQMSDQELDLLVIGGGITGAGIALDGASRGFRVGLIEKQDFAEGTSSRSTKLIHGGLRYLKQGEVALVREVGRERAILYRNAPHIVIPEKMLLPLVKGGTYGKWVASIGLWVYDRLAEVEKAERRIMLSKEETIQQEPLLRKDILKGGGLYIEYRTDDARLTIEVMKTAASYGAICANYVEALSFIYEDGKVIGILAEDRLTGEQYTIYAKKIVNATGPWTDQLRAKDHSLYGKRLHLTKGVHLVVPYNRFPLKQSVYFDVPDGRMVFAIPRGTITYFGTTDTHYHGNLERPRVTKNDVDYLLDAVNHMFPTIQLKREDITSSWAGLRPLIHEDGKSPSQLSRKDEIILSHTGLITIAGGKLTGFRKMAERVVDLVAEHFGGSLKAGIKSCHTDQIILSGGNFKSLDHIGLFIQEQLEMAHPLNLDEDHIRKLVYKYGTNTEKIVNRAIQLREENDWEADDLLLKAEMDYCIEEEMTTNLNDFLIRRTGRCYYERDALDEATIEKLLVWMGERFAWEDEQKEGYLKRFLDEYRMFVEFADEE